ncbi:MAG: serine hydrolase domain-containing protein [Pseudomonadales bacterium]
MHQQTEVEGVTDPHFDQIVEVFREGFDAGRDVGAGVAITIEGELVVDLWAGHTDRRRTRPWRRDTLVCMFSVTKAMTAICLLQAVDRELVALDAPVADYWPEFASGDKGRITIRQLMSHQAGLVGFHDKVPQDIYYDWQAVTAALAGETPWWTPGTRHGYHARTFGFLLGEVLRRVSDQTVGQWYAANVAQPLGLDFFIGLTDDQIDRCADILPARVRPGEEKFWPDAMRRMLKDFNNAATPTGAAFQNPSLRPGYMNTADFRRAEMPALNGHGTAAAVAVMYGEIARILSPATLEQATRTHSLGPDEVLKSVTHFGLGFMLHHELAPIGVRSGSFGHAGAGGSMAFYDPGRRLGFCFAMNQMQEGVVTGGTSAMQLAEAACEICERIR